MQSVDCVHWWVLNCSYLTIYSYIYAWYTFQVYVRYSFFSVVSLILLVFITYCFTLEQFLQLPFVLFVICSAVLIELFFQPLRHFLNRSEELLRDTKFTWSVQFGAMLMIGVWSTQRFIVSFLLFTIIITTIKIQSRRNKRFKTLKKKPSSQELERVTVDK